MRAENAASLNSKLEISTDLPQEYAMITDLYTYIMVACFGTLI